MTERKTDADRHAAVAQRVTPDRIGARARCWRRPIASAGPDHVACAGGRATRSDVAQQPHHQIDRIGGCGRAKRPCACGIAADRDVQAGAVRCRHGAQPDVGRECVEVQLAATVDGD
jgi:hypothetical protein